MKLKVAVALVAALLGSIAAAAPAGARASGSLGPLGVPVVGAPFTGRSGQPGTFSGTLWVEGFEATDGGLVLVGELMGLATFSDGGTAALEGGDVVVPVAIVEANCDAAVLAAGEATVEGFGTADLSTTDLALSEGRRGVRCALGHVVAAGGAVAAQAALLDQVVDANARRASGG